MAAARGALSSMSRDDVIACVPFPVGAASRHRVASECIRSRAGPAPEIRERYAHCFETVSRRGADRGPAAPRVGAYPASAKARAATAEQRPMHSWTYSESSP